MVRLITALLAFFPLSIASGSLPPVSEPPRAEITCLAAIAYYEARGEGRKGQEAVMHVALNRARANRTSVCKELVKPSQFSFMRGKKIPKVSDVWMRKAREMLLLDMHGYRQDITKGSLYFVHNEVLESQVWAQKMRRVAVIGKHVFLKEK